MKNIIKLYANLVLTTAFLSVIATAQSGGAFSIEQSVIASGGGTSSDISNIFTLGSTIGQPIATTDTIPATFTLRSGFRTPAPFAPTAAEASIQGRVIFGKNSGINNAFVTLLGGSLPDPIVARTNGFGYFTFNNIEVGHFYILTVIHKRYIFSQNTQTFTLFGDSKGLIFQANSEN